MQEKRGKGSTPYKTTDTQRGTQRGHRIERAAVRTLRRRFDRRLQPRARLLPLLPCDVCRTRRARLFRWFYDAAAANAAASILKRMVFGALVRRITPLLRASAARTAALRAALHATAAALSTRHRVRPGVRHNLCLATVANFPEGFLRRLL